MEAEKGGGTSRAGIERAESRPGRTGRGTVGIATVTDMTEAMRITASRGNATVGAEARDLGAEVGVGAEVGAVVAVAAGTGQVDPIDIGVQVIGGIARATSTGVAAKIQTTDEAVVATE